MNDRKKLLVSLTNVIQVLEDIGCAGVFNEIELKDGTKEECLKALDDIKMLGGINIPLESLETIENLIEEHFDNPPLELNDLEIEKPYWDNEEKEWCFFVKLHKDIGTGVKISVSVVPMMCAFQYKENRFYRKEVKK